MKLNLSKEQCLKLAKLEEEADCAIGAGLLAADPLPKPPYPFCRTPEKCVGKGYCPAEFACND